MICGLSIGQKGKAAAVNRLQTDRAPVSEFAHSPITSASPEARPPSRQHADPKESGVLRTDWPPRMSWADFRGDSPIACWGAVAHRSLIRFWAVTAWRSRRLWRFKTSPPPPIGDVRPSFAFHSAFFPWNKTRWCLGGEAVPPSWRLSALVGPGPSGLVVRTNARKVSSRNDRQKKDVYNASTLAADAMCTESGAPRLP